MFGTRHFLHWDFIESLVYTGFDLFQVVFIKISLCISSITVILKSKIAVCIL